MLRPIRFRVEKEIDVFAILSNKEGANMTNQFENNNTAEQVTQIIQKFYYIIK